MAEARVAVPGSERAEPTGAVARGDAPPGEVLEVTVVLRRHAKPPDPVTAGDARKHISRAEFAARYGATAADIAAVESFAHAAGLTVVGSDAARRSVILRGTVSAMNAAFGTHLRHYEQHGATIRVRTGAVSMPTQVST